MFGDPGHWPGITEEWNLKKQHLIIFKKFNISSFDLQANVKWNSSVNRRGVPTNPV